MPRLVYPKENKQSSGS